jgi:hypothetical protein
MILTEQVGTVLKSNDVTSKGFSIKASRKAFEILSAGLYSDKVRAIIRELSTNAADAHIAAGKPDVPFKVHLPNNLEPWFAVEDYGTGLSEERMLTLYTTYFDSDKTGSNDFTGALGLGSKSPFSYTDSFSVESRFDGEKKVYNAYLDEDGLPSISKMTEQKTDEPNGLTIRFPVKSADFYAFREKAAATLRWFKVQPKVTGATIEFPQTSYLRKTDWYGVTKSREGRSYAVMGNIAYPIEVHEFLSDYGNDKVSKLRTLVEWGIELYVNIGDFDIAASREKLGYDKKTVNLLKEKLTAALLDLEAEVTKDINTQPTIWKARVKLHEVRNSFKGFAFTAEYNGEKINDFVKIGTKEVVTSAPGVVPEVRVNVPVALGERLKIKSKNAQRIVLKKDKADTIYADGTVVFLADERGAHAAVRRYLADKAWDTQVILLTEYDQDWLKESGVLEACVKTSTLPKPPKVSYSNGRGGASVKAKFYEYVPGGNSGNGSSAASAYWKPADEVDVDEQDGVYVEILYFNARHKDGEPTFFPGDLARPLNLLKELGKGVKLYGIRPSDKAVLDDAEGEWLSLKDYAKQTLDEAALTYGEDHQKLLENAAIEDGYYRRINASSYADAKFVPNSKFGAFVKAVLEAQTASRRKDVKSYGELLNWVLPRTEDVKTDRLHVMQEEVYESYPLLKHLDRYGSDQESAVVEYVNLLDQKKTAKVDDNDAIDVV